MLPEAREERAEQQLLGQAHAGMRWHFKSPQFDQAKPSAAAVGGVKFINTEFGAMGVARHIDEQMAEEAIDQPGRDLAFFRNLPKSRLDLVKRFVPIFIAPWVLARGADEQAAKEKGKRRMILPIGNHAA